MNCTFPNTRVRLELNYKLQINVCSYSDFPSGSPEHSHLEGEGAENRYSMQPFGRTLIV